MDRGRRAPYDGASTQNRNRAKRIWQSVVDPERWKRVCEIFEGALLVAEGKRSEWIERECGPDLDLRREVEALLTVDRSDPRTLGELTRERTPIASTGAERNGNGAGAGSDETDEAIGRIIGGYRLLERIGDGGMGRVYLAERADGEFDTRVAIKLLRRGMDTDDILARFRRERQVLADLKHENIARLIDGGSTDEGLPYLVMEHIDGVTLDRYCSEHSCDVEERLRVFRRICDAVAYAHGNLVIHRDLKPGNILVDGDGVPKLLDFGIAKVLQSEAGDATIDVTAPLLRRLTPGYASPEQTRGERMTTATDVYSLGVVLFELLTGARPGRPSSGKDDRQGDSDGDGDGAAPASNGPAGTMNQVGTRRASTAVTGTSPEAKRLRKRLSGDLDTILQMAMREEPERRYASVRELADDIDRHLTGLPVRARPDSLLYRTTKFVHRHRVGLALATTATVFLIASVATIINFWLDADRSAAIARSAEDAASLREYIARISAADVAILAGNLAAARDQLDATDREHRGWEYWHLRHKLRSSGRTLVGRTDHPIHDLEFTPDGRSMVSVSNEVIVWDTSTDAVRARYRGGEAALGAAHHPTRGLLAIAHPDGRVIAYDYDADRQVKIGEPYRDDEPRDEPLSVAFSPEGSLLAVEDHRGTVRVWSADALEEEPRVHEKLTVGDREIHFLPGAESPRFLALTRQGICVFEARAGELLSIASPYPTRHFVSDSSGSAIWTNVSDGILRRIDFSGKTPAVEASIMWGRISGVALDRTGSRLAVAAADGSVQICDANNLEVQSRFEDESLAFQSVAISPDGSTLALGSDGRTIRIWSLDEAPESRWQKHSISGAVCFPGDSSLVFMETGPDGSQPIHVDLTSGTKTSFCSLDPAVANSSWNVHAWAPDGSSAVCTSQVLAPILLRYDDTSIRLAVEEVKHASYSPDGEWVAVVDEQDRLHCFRTRSSGQTDADRLRKKTGSLAPGIEAACSTWIDSDHLLIGDRHGRVHHVQRSTAQIKNDWPILDAEIFSISAAHDRSLVALGSSDGAAAVFDVATARVIHRTARHESSVTSVALSTTGSRLAIGSNDGVLRLVDVTSGEVTFTQAIGQPVQSLAFNPDDRTLAVCLRSADLHLLSAGTPIEHLVDVLFEELVVPSEVQRKLNSMSDLADSERVEARRAATAATRRLDPAKLNEKAWRIASLPGAHPDEYELARRQAAAAVELDPDNGYLLNTLGATLFRCGQIDDAIEVLERSRELNGGRLPADDALLCMAYASRGDAQAARAAIGRLETIYVAGEWGWSTIKLVAEARQALDRERQDAQRH